VYNGAFTVTCHSPETLPLSEDENVKNIYRWRKTMLRRRIHPASTEWKTWHSSGKEKFKKTICVNLEDSKLRAYIG
jgi:hypothetical protein